MRLTWFPRSIAAAAAALLLVAPAIAGPDVEEGTRDAGSTPTSAKRAKGTGSCNSLSGDLSVAYIAGDICDMFLIYVPNPAVFSAMTDTATGFDTMLWLFRVTTDTSGAPIAAYAIAGNDDMSTTTTASKVYFPPPATGGTWPAGVYAVAVTPYAVRPFGLDSSIIPQQLFLTGAATALLLPSPFGGNNVLKVWDGATVSGTGSYSITLAGATMIPLTTGTGVCGDVFSGDCYTATSTKGCSNPECCTLVCGLDPACCNVAWDNLCATIAWQNCPQCSAPMNTCPADLNGDGIVDGADLGILLTNWGICP